MEKKIAILEKITNVSTLPTLPTVLEKINNLLKNPQTSAEEIGKAITTDQALASKVLKLVNSAFYGFPGRISTITHAVVILGFSTIKNIVLTASIFDSFKNNKSQFATFNMEKFWLHSIACGACAQTLAKYIGNKDKEECFIAGLIHDLGKIVICQYLPDEFKTVIEYIHKNNSLFYDSEKEIFDATHQEVGGFIAESWNLPPNLQYAVKYHHAPSPNENYYISTAIVHFADILVRALDYGNSGDNKIPCIEEHVWNTFRLNEKKLTQLLKEISIEIEKALVFMNI